MRLWLDITLIAILLCFILLFVRSSKRKDARSGDVITTVLQLSFASLLIYILMTIVDGLRILCLFVIGEQS